MAPPPPALMQPDWGSGDSVDQYSQSTYPVVFASLMRQKQEFESLTTSIYATIQKEIAAGNNVEKSLLQTYEQYNQRLRQITGDLADLGRQRLDELKIQAHLASQSESKVTQINITIVPPPPPVETPYQAADYIKKELHEHDEVEA